MEVKWGFVTWTKSRYVTVTTGLLILKYSTCQLFIEFYESRTLGKVAGGDINMLEVCPVVECLVFESYNQKENAQNGVPNLSNTGNIWIPD